MVTFSPDCGITPPGHCVAFDHTLTKSYLINYPAGAGHKYLQYMPTA